MDNKKLAIIDIETSGLYCGEEDKVLSRILRIDAIKIENGEIGENFSSLVACGKYINKHVRELTGISNKILKGAPKINTVLKQLKKFTKGYVVYARNSEFVNKFLSYYGKKCGVQIDLVCDVLTSVLSILDPLLELIELVLDLLGPILGILTPLITILLNLINFALQPGLKMISLIVELVSKKLANAIKMITLLLTPLIRFLQVLWDIFGKIYTVISNLISKAINPFKEALDGIFDKLGSIFDITGGVLDKVSGLFGGGSDSGGGGIVSNVVSGVKGAIGKVKGFLGLAEGGYVGPNSPRTVVIGDNTKEGEIVSPISKMRNTVLQALRIFSSASNPAGAASTLGKEASNRTVSQIVNITNQFNGGTTDQQKNGARAMKKSAEDATGIMARGLAYAR